MHIKTRVFKRETMIFLNAMLTRRRVGSGPHDSIRMYRYIHPSLRLISVILDDSSDFRIRSQHCPRKRGTQIPRRVPEGSGKCGLSTSPITPARLSSDVAWVVERSLNIMINRKSHEGKRKSRKRKKKMD